MREIAGLLTILHAQSLDIPRAARIAGVVCADNDVELSWLYLDLILIALAPYAPEEFEARMNSLGYEYQSYFARRYYGQGKAAQARVRGAPDAQLDAVAERMLTAKTLEEAVNQLF